MKMPAVVLATGVIALIAFAIWGVNQTKTAAIAEDIPIAKKAQAAPEVSQTAVSTPTHQAQPTEPQAMPTSSVAAPRPPVNMNSRTPLTIPGDIDGAIALYENESEMTAKMYHLSELAYQPAESAKIHKVLLSALASKDKAMRETAYETILYYEDRTMIPKLQELAENAESDLASEKAQEAIEFLEMPSMRELKEQAKRTGKPIVPSGTP